MLLLQAHRMQIIHESLGNAFKGKADTVCRDLNKHQQSMKARDEAMRVKPEMGQKP